MLSVALQHLCCCSEWCVSGEELNKDAGWFSENKSNRQHGKYERFFPPCFPFVYVLVFLFPLIIEMI